MCPKLKDGLCEITSIEPKRISCADEKCCKGSEWDRCRIYIAQFFLRSGEKP